ncbi:MAG: SsrA-binding protein SmpB [Fastidiosipilaceae bacterium]|jgi:SsrA-binding protein|nr:SsrA-binding protein SmpB [Clostridiaceae bacterium]
MKDNIKLITKNRKARREYEIIETYEAGIELKGTEVKSIRLGNVNIADSYAMIKNNELYLVGAHISPYEQGNRYNVDPTRDRKLLMHKKEIMRLFGRTQQQGLTLIPLSLYFKNSRVKVELALGKGKKLHDKREDIIRRETDRAVARNIKNFNN